MSRAPYAQIRSFKDGKGWDLLWYSCYGSTFNYDFHVTLDESVAPILFNYRDKAANPHGADPSFSA